jgi:hypothetical protein
MLNSVKSLHKEGSMGRRTVLISLMSALIILVSTPAQDYDYWANAPAGKIKIFSISFVDDQNGVAKSAEGEVLATADGGRSWAPDNEIIFAGEKSSPQILWGTDVYCSVMKTTDGGITWLPYEEEKQEHFCGVYLKDSNTGYKVASEFLNKVTNEITNHLRNNDLDSLADHPHKCTEYYRSAEDGWALGWCIKDFYLKKYR